MMFYNTLFFYVSAFFTFIAALVYARYFFKHEPVFFSYSKQWLCVGFIAGVFFFFIRWREFSYLPLVTLLEITFFYAGLLSVGYILFVKEQMPRFIQGLLLFIINGIFILDLFLDKTLQPINPILNSFWLGIHVPAVMLGYSAFGLSFAISAYHIISRIRGKSADYVDSLNSGLILTGMILLGIGIITGSIWARSAWGRYWSWDPKETWALITFIIYACAVILRKALRKNALWQSVISVAGFFAMLFTFFGVSLLLGSHHAYK